MILVICIHTRSETNWKTSFVYQKKENLQQMEFFSFLLNLFSEHRSFVALVFFPARFLLLFRKVSYFIWCGYCYVKFECLSRSPLSSHPLSCAVCVCVVWRIEWLECVYDAIWCFPIQSNRINQTCLKISFRFFILISRSSLMLLLHHLSFGSRRSSS